MEFISPKQQVEKIVYSYCVSPVALTKELNKIGFTYVKVRRNALVKYICRNAKDNTKVIVKL